MRVGFVGLGVQGGPIADQIISGGHSLTVWARRRDVSDAYFERGAAVAEDLRALGAASDIVGVCVVDDQDVEAVGAGLLDGLAPGSVIVVHSTVAATTVKRLAAAATTHGVDVLDAPVIGGAVAARNRTLAVAVGGDDQVFAKCTSVLASYGDPIVHVGVVGDGQVMKLLFNLLFVVNIEVMDRFADIAAELGLDRSQSATLFDYLRTNTFAARFVQRAIPSHMLEHAVKILQKDYALARTLLDDSGTDPAPLDSLGAAALERCSQVTRSGQG